MKDGCGWEVVLRRLKGDDRTAGRAYEGGEKGTPRSNI